MLLTNPRKLYDGLSRALISPFVASLWYASYSLLHSIKKIFLHNFQFKTYIMNEIAEEAMEEAGNHLLPNETGIDFCRNITLTDIFQFNFSEYDHPAGEGGGPWPPHFGLTSALKIVFCVVNMIVSILGNTSVIIAVYHNPVLRSTINFYLVKRSKFNSIINLVRGALLFATSVSLFLTHFIIIHDMN